MKFINLILVSNPFVTASILKSARNSGKLRKQRVRRASSASLDLVPIFGMVLSFVTVGRSNAVEAAADLHMLMRCRFLGKSEELRKDGVE